MNLHKLLAFSIVAAMMMFVADSRVDAQVNSINGNCGCGYGSFGLYGNGLYGYTSYDLPYFSVHPPVYYSDRIVRRPYGVSPYAAPPGIQPVEYSIAVEPTVIQNPHFKGNGKETEAAPNTEAPKTEEKPKGKKTSAQDGTQAKLNVIIYNKYYREKSEPSALANVLK